MVIYKVTVSTANVEGASTFNNVFIKLVGTEAESERKWLMNLRGASAFTRGVVSNFTVDCPTSIGKPVLIELDKQPLQLFPEDEWLPTKVEVECPDGQTYKFPIYRCIPDSKVYRFKEATALKVYDDTHPLGRSTRQQEVKQREEDFCWDVYAEGLPHCMKTDASFSLPYEGHASFINTGKSTFEAIIGLVVLKLRGLATCLLNWTSMDDIIRVFSCKRTEIADHVQEHWKEDWFFGYQFLNGVNPMVIQRITALPSNFPVTDNMVFPKGDCTLADEMKKGNIFLCDYKILDGVKCNIINGKKQYLMAPLVLLHKTADDKMMPIAIQLKQKPSEDNPIFLPTDSEYDWLTAKIFVRNAEFNEHQLNVHLLRTHLMAEVFAVSLMRNLPMVHPLYKLLIPHTHNTLQINFLARTKLLSEDGILAKILSAGREGITETLRRSLSSITYSSLCIHDNIAERGLKDVPNYYYRDDGLRLWDIIYRFVQKILAYYYQDDCHVQQDIELQKWILDIFVHGFLSQESTGIPQRFTTVAELVKFITMVIFTGSVQHASVNGGQFDYGSWMPNLPSSLQLPPPTKKGTTSEATMLATFPDVNIAVQGISVLWLLSSRTFTFIPLGQYPEEHFSEKIPCKLIEDFRGELEKLSKAIKARNKDLEVPYTYLDPEEVENSVSI